MTIDPRRASGVDGELWRVGAIRIARMPGGAVAEIEDARLVRLATALARSGIALTGTAGAIDEGPPLVPAIALALTPLAAVPVRCDVVALRAVSVADATRALHRAPGRIRRPSPRVVARCRAILHDEEHVLAWRRVVWAERAVFRRRLSGLRPVVFDRDAVVRPPERWTFASERQIERWLAA